VDPHLEELNDAGQSIWLDNIQRSMFSGGELRRLIDAGIRGMTSNPTIFGKAMGAGDDYDAQLRSLVASETDPNRLFESLAIDDIQHACDLFRPLYDSTNGGDGFVSLEVSPALARDTQGTIAAARRLWDRVDRPNVMIKIPSTPDGLPAVTEAIASGINVNVTLMFSLEHYEQTADAYLAGLERRAEAGESLQTIASVASVFVSRIDTMVDKAIDEKVAAGDTALGELKGQIGIANLKLVYQKYKELFEGDRFAALKAKGAHVQRPLWASTGTKNKAYSDVMYVENVIGPNTVNTVPPDTLEKIVDHLKVRVDSVEDDVAGAREVMRRLEAGGISLSKITATLQDQGVDSFADSYNEMLESIAKKRDMFRADGDVAAVAISANGATAEIDASVNRVAGDAILKKLWQRDASAWSNDPAHATIIEHALGWLTFPRTVGEHLAELETFATEAAAEFSHVVVLGMGGSSLAPDVLRVTFGKQPNFPRLHVLDSSDPEQIRALEAQLDLSRSLFIVASKSGSTTEPDAFFRYFHGRVAATVGDAEAGKHFIAITDPGTRLAAEAKDRGFRKTFENDPDIGGRYSALSYFGMVPAVLAGYDVPGILERGLATLDKNGESADAKTAPGVRFGSAIGTLAKAGRDKLTIITHPAVAAFGTWAEQLIAESTGKSGTGIIPVEGEQLGEPEDYGSDRVFVYVGAGLAAREQRHGDMDADTIESRLTALEAAGHPVIRLHMNDTTDVGEQFALWEIATAIAGSILGIDAFDQPNVQESKDNTKRLLGEYDAKGSFSEPAATATTDIGTIIPLSGSKTLPLGSDLARSIGAVLGQVKPGDYVAFTAYVERNDEHEQLLSELRLKVRNALKVATTVGFGPRFLHSTGQLHKGGPNSGLFFQLTYDIPKDDDLPIPGMASFATLLRSQALGDFESLDSRDRRGFRFQMAIPVQRGLEALAAAFDEALAVRHG